MLAKLSGFNPKGQYVSLEKEKQNFCVVLTYSIKREHESRKFQVVVVQQRLRNVQKSVIFFANLKHITTVFLLFTVTVAKLLQKFCYHGNVTSHFCSLLS